MADAPAELTSAIAARDAARETLESAQETAKVESMSEKQISKEIKRLEKLMVDHAKNLEFEEAARLRDQIFRLEKLDLELL